MKHIARILMLSAAGFMCAGVALADTVVVSNTSVVYTAGQARYTGAPNNTIGNFTGLTDPTFALGPSVSPWMSALTGSSWISFDPGSAPGGAHDNGSDPNPNIPDGTYVYTLGNLDLTAGQLYSVTFSVLADDTTSVLFDGTQEIAPGSGKASHCVTTGVTCTMVYNPGSPFMLTATGSDVLEFDVNQMFGSATGLDFVVDFAPVGPVPEPSSLMLLGTGLLGAAGVLRRRIRG